MRFLAFRILLFSVDILYIMFGSLDAFNNAITDAQTQVNKAISATTPIAKRAPVGAAIGGLSSLEDAIDPQQRQNIEMQVSNMKRQLDSQPQQQFMPQMPSPGFFGLTSAPTNPTIELVDSDLRQVDAILQNMINAATTQNGYTGMGMGMGQTGMTGMGMGMRTGMGMGMGTGNQSLFTQNPQETDENQKLMSQVMSQLPLLVSALSHLKHIAFVLGHQEFTISPYQSRNMQGPRFNQIQSDGRYVPAGGKKKRRTRRRKQRGGCSGYSKGGVAANAAPFTGGRKSRRHKRKSHKRKSHRR